MVHYKTLEEATNAKLDLVERIQGIDAQLAERAAEVSGQRLPEGKYREYLEWKARACRAKVVLSSKLARTKVIMHQMRTQSAKDRAEADGAEGMLRDLLRLVRTLASEGVDLSPEEQALVDDVSFYLDK